MICCKFAHTKALYILWRVLAAFNDRLYISGHKKEERIYAEAFGVALGAHLSSQLRRGRDSVALSPQFSTCQGIMQSISESLVSFM